MNNLLSKWRKDKDLQVCEVKVVGEHATITFEGGGAEWARILGRNDASDEWNTVWATVNPPDLTENIPTPSYSQYRVEVQGKADVCLCAEGVAIAPEPKKKTAQKSTRKSK